MLNQDTSRVDFVSTTTPVNYDWKGYTSFGADIEGTIGTGSGKFQGSSGGIWTDVTTFKDGNILAGGTVTTSGHYQINTASFEQGRFLPSDDFDGLVKITANMGVEPLNIILGL